MRVRIVNSEKLELTCRPISTEISVLHNCFKDRNRYRNYFQALIVEFNRVSNGCSVFFFVKQEIRTLVYPRWSITDKPVSIDVAIARRDRSDDCELLWMVCTGLSKSYYLRRWLEMLLEFDHYKISGFITIL